MVDDDDDEHDDRGWSNEFHFPPAPLPQPAAVLELRTKLQEGTNQGRLADIAWAQKLVQDLTDSEEKDASWLGDSVRENIARGLAISVEYLSDLCRVFEVFDDELLKIFRTRTSASGNVISLGHLLVISRATDDQIRQELVEEFYQKDLTTEELESFIWADSHVIKVHHWRTLEPSPDTPLGRILDLTRVSKKIAKALKFWAPSLLRKTKWEFPNRQFTILRNRIDEARSDLRKNLKNLNGIAEELDQTYDYLMNKRKEPQDVDLKYQRLPKPRA